MSEYLLNYPTAVLEQANSYWTAKEIDQQPRVWREAAQNIAEQRSAIEDFLVPIVADTGLKIILLGAGSSSFIGEAIAPHLRQSLKRRVEAIKTTDILAAPELYLEAQTPTLAISFARSGDSPESLAAVALVNQLVEQHFHLVLTCNPDGSLAKACAEREQGHMHCLLMPEGTNDRSFAMTSSYSSMIVSCLCVFEACSSWVEQTAQMTERLFAQELDYIQTLAQRPFNRLVILGAGSLLGCAQESALKMLELSAGQVVPMHDSPLGFRHGPKSVVDKNTLIVHFHSANAYTELYDRDLFAELNRDDKALSIIGLSADNFQLDSKSSALIDDIWLGLVYVVFCQVLGFYKAINLGIGADNPCPSGEVNRVVQGVSLYPYGSQAE